MAKLTMKVEWQLSVDVKEFRLISSALRGALKEEDRPAAAALQVRLMEERAKQADGFAESMEQHAQNAGAGRKDG